MTTKVIQADRLDVARIIDPIAFKAGEALRDYCIRQGDDEVTAQRYADDVHGPDQRDALAKAEIILASHADPLRRALEEVGKLIRHVKDDVIHVDYAIDMIDSVASAALSSGENNNVE